MSGSNILLKNHLTEILHSLIFQYISFTELTDGFYNAYTNRRVEGMITSLHTSSRLECTTLCYKTDSCLAVNVIGNTCQLTRSLSNEDELLVDSTSMVFVLGGVCYLFTVYMGPPCGFC